MIPYLLAELFSAAAVVSALRPSNRVFSRTICGISSTPGRIRTANQIACHPERTLLLHQAKIWCKFIKRLPTHSEIG